MLIRWTTAALRKIADHGVTVEEAEEALEHPHRTIVSDASGLPIACRWQGDRWLYVVYVEEFPVRPITAYFIYGD